MDDLSPTQLAAVEQLRDLTNGGDDDVSVSVLSSVGWDVQRAADMIFGTGAGLASSSPAASSSSTSGSRMEEFDIDDSEQDGLLRRPPPPMPHIEPSTVMLSILTYPLRLITNLFRFVFTVLRIPLPRLGPFLSLNFYSRPMRRPSTSGSYGPERWIHELEEETGAVCIGRSGQAGASTGIAGPSHLTARGGGPERYLPDFTTESYERVLRRAQKEAKIACVVLVSDEHDDVAEFKRTTLTDPSFVNALTANDVIVYGGDVRYVDAYSASEKLNVTTYPFVAFISPQPPRSRSSSSPSVTILSRHQGASQTTASALVQHLTTSVLPRVQPYLSSRRNLERERELRQEQDRAFEDSARRDTERIRRKMEEERQREKARLLEEERLRLEADREEERREERMRWRRYMRRAVVPAEAPGVKGGIRVAVRFQNGGRAVRTFVGERDTLTTLYAFVDAEAFIPPEVERAGDPELPPTSLTVDELAGDEPGFWGFTLVTAYPRKEVAWRAGTLLRDVDALKDGSAQLVIETASSGSPKRNGKSQSSDDEYETESEEE